MIELGAGLILSTYQESSTEPTFKLEAGYENVYLWGSYEVPHIKFLGNPVADTDIYGFGLGFRKEVRPGITLFIEGGYAILDESVLDTAEEMVYTQIVGNHAVEGRKVPVSGAYSGDYSYSYEIDDAWMGRIGVNLEVMDNVHVTASYRAMKADQEYAIWDEESRAAGRGYWREDDTYDFGAFEVGIFFRY